mmetsp:Transcript_80611/g.207490  ORF Transcript_80611/g.207490 Transcript_80611/m.207490 type:complete len:221 (-) Transcript_80611:113-775(-)
MAKSTLPPGAPAHAARCRAATRSTSSPLRKTLQVSSNATARGSPTATPAGPRFASASRSSRRPPKPALSSDCARAPAKTWYAPGPFWTFRARPASRISWHPARPRRRASAATRSSKCRDSSFAFRRCSSCVATATRWSRAARPRICAARPGERAQRRSSAASAGTWRRCPSASSRRPRCAAEVASMPRIFGVNLLSGSPEAAAATPAWLRRRSCELMSPA